VPGFTGANADPAADPRDVHVALGLLTLRPGQIGGSETTVRGLLTSLSRSAEAEHDRFTVVTSRAGARSLAGLVHGPVAVVTPPSHRSGRSAATSLLAIARGRYLGARLRREALERAAVEAFDVAHYPLTVDAPPLHAPAVVTILDLQHEVMPEFFSPLQRAYRRVFYAGAIRRASAIVTISEYCKASIVDRHRVPPERVFVSPHGVDRDLFGVEPAPDEPERLAQLGLPERFLVYPANLWPHKNHFRLLHGLSRQSDTELGLVLTGQDYGRWPALRRQARALGLQDRVRHLGYVERPVLPALYRRACGMVFPSLFEGLGLPPLEALACGCPVAASNSTALPETLSGRAILFDPRDVDAIGDGIDRLVASSDRSSPGPDFWSRFTWEAAALEHRSAYRLAVAAGEPADARSAPR